PLERTTRQLVALPSGVTRMATPTVPRSMPLMATRRRYSWLGIWVIFWAGVNPPEPPPPGPLPEPPAPVPVPELPAPEVDALPVPAIFAAGMGEGAGMRGCGATTGVASAFFAGAPASRLACSGARLGGGGLGGGGGGSSMSKVFRRSTAWLTMRTLS